MPASSAPFQAAARSFFSLCTKKTSHSTAFIARFVKTHAPSLSKYRSKKYSGFGIVVVGRRCCPPGSGQQACSRRRRRCCSPPQLLLQPRSLPPAPAPRQPRDGPRGGGEPGDRRSGDGGSSFLFSFRLAISPLPFAFFFDLFCFVLSSVLRKPQEQIARACSLGSQGRLVA